MYYNILMDFRLYFNLRNIREIICYDCFLYVLITRYDMLTIRGIYF